MSQIRAAVHACGGDGTITDWSLTLRFDDGDLVGHPSWQQRTTYSNAEVPLPVLIPALQHMGGIRFLKKRFHQTDDPSAVLRLRVVDIVLDPVIEHSIGEPGKFSGAVVLECEGEGWQPWVQPRRAEMPRGACLIYHAGRILGRATVERGVERVVRGLHLSPPASFGWHLVDLPFGRAWVVRPSDEVVQRLHQLHAVLKPVPRQLLDLANLDLAGETEAIRELLAMANDIASAAERLLQGAKQSGPHGQAVPNDYSGGCHLWERNTR
ncbi:hypothetical protein [Azospirillum thermophilum]|uniref:hypothetical protein n=1 Tax=Azospirillum thermophilum TaxID=2202148 RepID=UPI0011B6F720|nr:hypothetical protein [Azospirillum thermophilum]